MPNAVEPASASPLRLSEALALLADRDGPPWRPLAGGTDLLVQIAGEIGEPPERVLDLWSLDELRGIDLGERALRIGALTTYRELRESPAVAEHAPALAAAAATIGAAQIQNRGTIGGNVANASPAGDTLPVLLALGATMILASAGGERRVAADDFWPAYRATALRRDELLVAIELPIVPGRHARFRKVGTRRAQAISKVVMALAWTDMDRGAWSDVRLALGSMAATTVRAPAAEAAMEGEEPTRATADAAAAALVGEVRPIDDVRSTAAYRRQVAGRVLHRLIRDEGGW